MLVYRKEEKKKTASLFSTDETLQCKQMVSVAEFTGEIISEISWF
jgi:hypothetical protein